MVDGVIQDHLLHDVVGAGVGVTAEAGVTGVMQSNCFLCDKIHLINSATLNCFLCDVMHFINSATLLL